MAEFKYKDIDKMKAPSFKMILTAVGSLAYRREDGIYVVPISSSTSEAAKPSGLKN